MKAKLLFGCIGLTVLLAGAQVYTGLTKSTETIHSLKTVDHSVLPLTPEGRRLAKQAAKRTVASRGFFYEDFEDCTGESPYLLPDGWSVSGEGWRGGTITLDGSPLQGVSGMKYAFIFANGKKANDDWAFSPAIEMEAHKTYQIQFYTLGITTTDVEESMEIMIGENPQPQAMTVSLGDTGDTDGLWRKKTFSFTPAKDGGYHLGFHSTTPLNKENNSGMIIDDLKVFTGAIPVLSCEPKLDFGKVGDLDPTVETTMTIGNYGNADMNVSLKACSEELTLEGLPAMIEAYEEQGVKVLLRPGELGRYEGFITLATDDPAAPEFTIKVTAQVEKSRVTGYILEDFESGGPEGWEFSTGCVNTADYPGHNSSSRCVYTSTYYVMLEGNEDGVGFTSHYVEMGDDPTLSFWYKLTDASFLGSGDPTEAERALVKVFVSELGSDEWVKAFEISEEGDMKHVTSADYAKATVNLSKFAGKTCKVKILFSQPDADDAFALMMNSIEGLVDDVEIGTPMPQDLGADFLLGKGAVISGDNCEAEVTITNYGSQEVESYKVELYSDSENQLLLSVEGETLAAGEDTKVKLSWPAGESGSTGVYALAVIDNDKNADNDRSNTLSIDILSPDNQTVAYNEGEKLLSGTFPINFGEVESFTQSIYPANSFGINRAEISSLVFYSNMNSYFKSESFEVFIGETEKETFDDSKPVALSALTKVYEGPMCFPNGKYDAVIPFITPYQYNGGNIVVMCRKLGKEFVNNRQFVTHKTPGIQSLQCYASEPGTLTNEPGGARILTNALLPDITFNFTATAPASLSGNITSEGKALENVKVSIDGTGIYTFTDIAGNYSFSGLVEDTYSITGKLHGYHNATKTGVIVHLDSKNTCDFEMSPLSTHSLSGTIHEKGSGKVIGGVSVCLKGYHNYETVSDAEGKYAFPEVYEPEDGDNYTVQIKSPFFEQQVESVNAIKDLTINFELRGLALRPNEVDATAEADGVKVTWGEPSAELRHDTGVMKEALGYPTGWEQIIFGTVYRTDNAVKEISWYLTDDNANHSNLNVFVFGLDSEGNPDPTNILYLAKDVDYTDNEWNVHKLSQPVKSKGGFMVALSCNGFMGIGVTEPTEAYPFESGMHFYAGQSYQVMISDMEEYEPLHLMLRATVEGMENATRPTGFYEVYRIVEDQPREEWTLIGTTSDKEITDAEAEQFEGKKIRYAVVSKANEVEAVAVLSDYVTISGINTPILASDVKIIYADGMLKVVCGSQVATLELYNMAGLRLGMATSDEMNVESVDKGVYLVKVTTADNQVVTTRFIMN